jgi:hypothetical protein
MLHELGHWELMRDWDLYKQKYHFTSIGEEYALNKIYKYRRRLAYKVDVMREEFDAWEAGRNLAIKLNLYLDINDYNKYSIKFLYLYIKHLGK